MGKYFGTDGFRGEANVDLTSEHAYRIGKFIGWYYGARKGRKARVVIGKDTRLSSDMLENAMAAGLCSVGASVVLLGVVPTPAVAYLVEKYKADAGVMISASHNSYEYNGIKIFSGDGYKLPDAIEDRIEEIVTGGMPTDFEMPIGERVGCPQTATSARCRMRRTRCAITSIT